MMRKIYLPLLFFPFICFQIYAQTDSLSGVFVDSAGRYYQRADLPVYLHISTSPNGNKVPLSGKQKNQKEAAVQPMLLDGHGKHLIKHEDGQDPRNSFEFAVYADALAPQSSSEFNTPFTTFRNGKRYYGQNLEISLSAKDQMSGLEGLFYSLDGQSTIPYTNPFALSTEGSHSLRYFSLDKVGNVEEENEKNFVVDVSPPISTYNVVGITEEQVISLGTKIYFTLEDNSVGVNKTFYRFDEQDWRSYRNNSVLNLRSLTDGNHTLYFYSTDFLKNEERQQSFSFYLDRTAPIMSADVLGDKFIVGEQVYFSGRTKLKLTAVDNKSGVKETWYSIDGGEFQQYKEPFYLPSKSGTHIIRYYAVDNTNNKGVEGAIDPRFDTYKHNVSAVYVDLTGPKLSYRYQGKTFKKGDLLYISPQTDVRLSATDGESGLQKITYRLNEQTGEIDYESPLNIQESGNQELEIIGYDNVNNRNVVNTSFAVDATPPSFFYHFSTSPESGDSYPSYVKIFLGAQDEQTDVENIYYRINGGGRRLYQGSISGFKTNRSYTVTLEVKDKLGNEAVEDITFNTLSY